MLTSNEAQFRNNISTIAIELNSDCNRKCCYCPHSIIKRPKTLMSSLLIRKIVNELKRIEYAGKICLNIYNEPLLYFQSLIETMSLIKSSLPNVEIHFSTNGDLLTKNRLDKLSLNGLSKLTISRHLNNWSNSEALKSISATLRTLSIDKFAISSKKNYLVSKIEYKHSDKSIPIRIFSSNFLKTGQNRANSLKGIVDIPSGYMRKRPCRRPITEMNISYDGSCYPCCMFFHGIADSQYIIGNCTTETLANIYMHSIRRHFEDMCLLKVPYENPCKDCTD